MSKEERKVVTAGLVEQLEERRETKAVARHNNSISAFHDVRVTLDSVKTEVSDSININSTILTLSTLQLAMLNERTGIDAMLFAVRSDPSQFNAPYSYATSERIANFVNISTKTPIMDYAVRLEGYCLSGIDGTYLHSCIMNMCYYIVFK